MFVCILKEAGYEEALLGLALSYHNGDDNDLFEKVEKRMPKRAVALAGMEGGHNKFLESIIVWLDIRMPRYWWSQFDTYRVGTTKQSESTMHTLTKRLLTKNDFSSISDEGLRLINYFIKEGNLEDAKAHLPESFLQRRIVCTNYKTLRNMVAQRSSHKLYEWRMFVDNILIHLEHPHFLVQGESNEG